MREILFKAKHTDNKEWVERYLVKFGVIYWIYTGKVDKLNSYTNGYGTTIYPSIKYMVDPETVCQYTGLEDKNGKKIFENDILSGERYHDWGQGGEYVPDKCVVKWNERKVAFEPFYWWDGYSHELKNYEVVGNIFDNPKLLGGDAD